MHLKKIVFYNLANSLLKFFKFKSHNILLYIFSSTFVFLCLVCSQHNNRNNFFGGFLMFFFGDFNFELKLRSFQFCVFILCIAFKFEDCLKARRDIKDIIL